MEAAANAPQIVEELVRRAEQARASDIHVQMIDGTAQVSFRLDGVLHPITTLPSAVADRVVGRIKYLARLKTYEESLPQEGRIDHAEVNAQRDIRVATYPTVTGEKLVLRLFTGQRPRTLQEVGLPTAACSELERFLRQPAGLLLLTGPAGSGKTTTIYACLQYLHDLTGRHIITVEDPVEQVIPGVMQTEVNDARGLTFGKAARYLLRQDPQVLVIGEIRDEETAAIAVRAALTGHLVIATLHAGSCRGVRERLADLCPDAREMGTVTGLVLNQRLVRRMCGKCAGEGCDECLRTGFRGQAPLVEWLRVPDMRSRDVEQPLEFTLDAAAADLVQRGITSQAECGRVLGR